MADHFAECDPGALGQCDDEPGCVWYTTRYVRSSLGSISSL